MPGKIAIYGMGDNGLTFYEKIKDKCKVTCFIDSAPKTKCYKDVPVVSVDEYKAQQDVTIIITPVYALNEIFLKLKEVCRTEVKMIALDRIIQQ